MYKRNRNTTHYKHYVPNLQSQKVTKYVIRSMAVVMWACWCCVCRMKRHCLPTLDWMTSLWNTVESSSTTRQLPTATGQPVCHHCFIGS